MNNYIFTFIWSTSLHGMVSGLIREISIFFYLIHNNLDFSCKLNALKTKREFKAICFAVFLSHRTKISLSQLSKIASHTPKLFLKASIPKNFLYNNLNACACDHARTFNTPKFIRA